MKILRKAMSLIIAAAIVGTVTIGLTGCSGGKTIVVGSKDFTENILLGEIFAQAIEGNTDYKVDRKLNLGGTYVCFEGIKNGDIDIYPEYTGTALTAELKMDVISDADEAYNTVAKEFDKQFNIKWLKELGLNNTYTLAVSKEVYEEYGVETFSDLVAISENLVFGAEHEFFNRQDGFEGLVEAYGLTFKGEPNKMNVALKYEAMGKGDMDVTDAFSTDAAIKKYDLKVLEDDKGFFPPYYAAPIVRNETLEKFPEIEEILNKLEGLIDDEAMMNLNYKVDIDGEDVAKTAKDFLKENGIID